ncbi:spermidine/putrescine ABC transporter ATP-binding protein, partial [Pantoea rodasii]
ASFHAVDFRLAQPDEPQFAVHVQRVIYRGGHYQIDVAPVAAPDTSITLLSDTPLPVIDATLGVALRDGWILPS